jgi:AraC-like DNA-binding protein
VDALSYVLAANRVTGMVAMQLRARGSWGLASDGIHDAAFFVIVQGSCWLRVGGYPPVQLVQGDVLLLPGGSAHVLSSSRNGRAWPAREVLAVHPPGEDGVVDLGGSGPIVLLVGGEFVFEHDRAHPVLSLLPPLMHIPGAPAPGAGELSTVVHMLASELAQPRPGSDAVVAHLADILFVHILRAWLAVHDPHGPSWLAALRDSQIGTALARLHAHPDRPWTIELLAAEVAMSRAAFARRFTRLVGDAPLAYLTRWRLNLAARRLRDTDDPIAAVAGQVGYGSEYSFSRAFTRYHGQPPGRYRRQSRASSESRQSNPTPGTAALTAPGDRPAAIGGSHPIPARRTTFG